MMRMRIKIVNCINIKTLKQTKRCSSKSNSYLLKRERNGQLRHPDFTGLIFYHPNQQQYLQYSILQVVFNISTIVLRTGLITVLLQHPIRQVGLTIHFKTYLVKNSDNIKYKAQKPCNENQSLKSTDLRQTQAFIES